MKLVIANWKMNHDLEKIRTIFKSFLEQNFRSSDKVKIAIAAPDLFLLELINSDSGKRFSYVAQNVSRFENLGAYTGETGVELYKSIGVDTFLIGHSERRENGLDSDQTVNAKIKSIVNVNLSPVMCFGDSYEDRINNNYSQKIISQLRLGLENLDLKDFSSSIYLAYEPVWAISTSKEKLELKMQDLHEINQIIKNEIRLMFPDQYDKFRLLFGGSVNRNNIEELESTTLFEGYIVGGASLDAQHFCDITKVVELRG